MKTCFTLPDGYTELQQLDLQKNPKLALLINALVLHIIRFIRLSHRRFLS